MTVQYSATHCFQYLDFVSCLLAIVNQIHTLLTPDLYMYI